MERRTLNRSNRGSLIIASLLLSAIVLLVGLGFLGKRRAQYRSTQSQHYEMAALSLAEAGLEDARIKLLKDAQFPYWQEGLDTYSYREQLTTGSYRVLLTRFPKEATAGQAQILNEYIVIEVEGSSGPPGDPRARRRLQAEMITRGEILSLKDLGTF